MDIYIDSQQNNEIITHLSGDFDALNINQVRQQLEDIASQNQAQRIVLDLSHVSFIDSSGIGAIVFLFKRLHKEKRELELTGAQGQPRQLLELLRIHQAMPVTWASV